MFFPVALFVWLPVAYGHVVELLRSAPKQHQDASLVVHSLVHSDGLER